MGNNLYGTTNKGMNYTLVYLLGMIKYIRWGTCYKKTCSVSAVPKIDHQMKFAIIKSNTNSKRINIP